jgi:hypothetical protein
VVAYTSPDQAGARTTRVPPSGTQAPGPALAREQWIRGLAHASPSWLGAAWAETPKPGGAKARILFDVLGGSGPPLELGTGRAKVNASTRDDRLAAATWSSISRGNTAVHWSVITFRQDGEAQGLEASIATPQ